MCALQLTLYLVAHLQITSNILHEMPRLQDLAVSVTTTFWKDQVVSKDLQFWQAKAQELLDSYYQIETVCFLKGLDSPCAAYWRAESDHGNADVAVPAEQHPAWLQGWDGR